jgi:hypothetical protein
MQADAEIIDQSLRERNDPLSLVGRSLVWVLIRPIRIVHREIAACAKARPPNAWASRRLIARPSPLPRVTPPVSSLTNSSKRRSRFSGAIPGPRSRTTNDSSTSRTRASSVTVPPALDYFAALPR